MSDNISCPADHILINENRARLTALFVLLAGLTYLLIPHWSIPACLVVDFFLRGFGHGQYSPLNLLSGWLVKILSIKNKPVDRAPKLFAAQLGFIMTDLLLISNVFDLKEGAYTLDAVLILFAFLESALGLCAGCYVYTFIKKISPKAIL
ncbi:MAG TPA: DUF4395 domain-containing protein [Puia sp.]|nr:DUF4395 domain-containing protein [Puia sp.]